MTGRLVLTTIRGVLLPAILVKLYGNAGAKIRIIQFDCKRSSKKGPVTAK